MSLAKDSNDLAASASNNSLYEAQYDHDLDHKDGEAPDADAPLTLRALVSTKEAGVIIGKAGKNVADLRDQTGVKAGVSKVVQGVHDRVLTVSGSIEGVAKVIISLFFITHLMIHIKYPMLRPPPCSHYCTLDVLSVLWSNQKKAVAILSLVYFCFFDDTHKQEQLDRTGIDLGLWTWPFYQSAATTTILQQSAASKQPSGNRGWQ